MSFVFDEFFPFDPSFGASANATRWRKMASLWQTDGVVANYLNSLNATSAGNQVTVQSGGCFVHGLYAELQSPKTFTVGTNGTIVAQASLPTNNEFVQLIYRDGITDYGTGGYEQDASIWEVPLWLISGGTLVDLRTLINPGGDLVWWGRSDSAVPVNAGTTQPVSVLTARVPYAGYAWMHGTMLLTFNDLSQAQSAICSLTYQYNVAGGESFISPNVITPAIAGWGSSGQLLSMPVSLTAWCPVRQGKKAAGWLVTAGTGGLIQVSQMTLSMRLAGVPPTA